MRPGLGGMSGAGLLVVGALCGSLILCVATLCAFSLAHPELNAPGALVDLLKGLVIAVPALLAKTYADARSSSKVEEPPAEPVAAPLKPRAAGRAAGTAAGSAPVSGG